MGVAINLAKAEGPEYTATKSLMIRNQTHDEFMCACGLDDTCGALFLHCSLCSEAQDLHFLLQSLTSCGLIAEIPQLRIKTIVCNF